MNLMYVNLRYEKKTRTDGKRIAEGLDRKKSLADGKQTDSKRVAKG